MLDEKNLRVAIRWLYENRHSGYWTYPILLSDKVDSKVKALNLTNDEAAVVFSVCEDLEFLKRLEGEPLNLGGVLLPKYRVNYAKLREYYVFSHPHFYYYWFPDFVIYTVEKYWMWIVGILALLLTSFFGGWVGALGEKIAQ